MEVARERPAIERSLTFRPVHIWVLLAFPWYIRENDDQRQKSGAQGHTAGWNPARFCATNQPGVEMAEEGCFFPLLGLQWGPWERPGPGRGRLLPPWQPHLMGAR